MINISIIGAGQIGSRHLQALAALNKDTFEIFVVDPIEGSLDLARQRYNELQSGGPSVTYLKDFEKLPSKMDIVILATGSNVRKQLIFQLLQEHSVTYLILEKFLFPSLIEYIQVEELLKKTGTIAYVNCARRMWDLYKEIKKYMKGPLDFNVVGNIWGLGSNGIHMLDLFSFLENDEKILLDGIDIDEKIQKSKREGYVEFTGTIIGKTKSRSTFRATSYNEVASPLTLFLSNALHRIIVKEDGAKASLMVSSMKNQWQWEETIFNVPFQSKLSDLFVTELIEKGTCELSSYNVSATLHMSMLEMFLDRMNKTSNRKTEVCPIT